MQITLNNVTKQYNQRILFEDINLTINQGDFVVIKGASGSGKTTLANIIGGMERPSNGTITFNPKPKNLYRNDIGFILQNYGLLENETIYDNLKMAYIGKSLKEDEIKQNIKDILETLKINANMYEFVKVLSGGERQRVAIGRMLLKKPNVIIADEPTGNLDSNNSKEIFKLLIKLNKLGTTIIMVTHEGFTYSEAIEYYL